MRSYFRVLFPALIVGLICPGSDKSYGQTIEQTIRLTSGWNAVYLEVQPDPQRCEAIFTDPNRNPDLDRVEAVWMWNPPVTAQDYVSLPTQPSALVQSQQWLAYFPEHPLASSLFTLLGARTYLVKVTGGDEIEWRISGTPCLPRIQWNPNAYNFVGFHVDDEARDEVFLERFFGGSSVHRASNVLAYELRDDRWIRIRESTSGTPARGGGYWIYAGGHSDFVGPLSLTLEQGTGANFGVVLDEQDMRVENVFDDKATIAVRLAGQRGIRPEGICPLRIVKPDSADPNKDHPLSEEYTFDLEPHGGRTLRLALDRGQIDPNQHEYRGVLEVRSTAGMRLSIPVQASRSRGSGLELWVGTASLSGVSLPASKDPTYVFPTASEFPLRMIIVRDCRIPDQERFFLLDEAIGLWTQRANRSMVLFSDEKTASRYVGSAAVIRNGVAIRVSSAAFSFEQPEGVELKDGLWEAGSSMTGTFSLGEEDSCNPFRHRYHPDHDGISDKDSAVPDTNEVYSVTRQVRLEFDAIGDTRVDGTYHETFTDLLDQKKIYVEGNLHLKKIADPGEWVVAQP